jgi:hypothetical protein
MGNGRGMGSVRDSRRVDCTTYLMMGNKNIIFVHNFRKVELSTTCIFKISQHSKTKISVQNWFYQGGDVNR